MPPIFSIPSCVFIGPLGNTSVGGRLTSQEVAVLLVGWHRWFLASQKIDFGICGQIWDRSSPEISCFGNFSPVEKGKEQGKQLKHEQAIVPKQNRETWALFEYCTGFFILLYWLRMKGQAKRASAKGFRIPFPKSLKKSCLSLGAQLKALNIVGYCKALSAIEVVNLLRISSSIDREKNNFGSQ